jgi:general secretion pathway protein H
VNLDARRWTPGRVRRGKARRASRGLSLIEIIVVLAIVAVVMGVAVAGSNQLPQNRLRRTGAMLNSATKVAYSRATATSRNLRLVMDIDGSRIWLEESDAPMLVQSKDTSGTGGAEAVTAAERAAREEGDKIVKGVTIAQPSFRKVDTYGFGDDSEDKGTKALQHGITFRSVQTAHDESPKTSGRAYLYFWPGGLTERAAIQIRIGDSDEEYQTMTLLVSPLTGKISIKPGQVELQMPTDDEHASDRQDTGL